MRKQFELDIKIIALQFEIDKISEELDNCNNQNRYWELGHAQSNLQNKLKLLNLYKTHKSWFDEWFED
jgi:hypothetical protein